jgi:hypothetical protein
MSKTDLKRFQELSKSMRNKKLERATMRAIRGGIEDPNNSFRLKAVALPKSWLEFQALRKQQQEATLKVSDHDRLLAEAAAERQRRRQART